MAPDAKLQYFNPPAYSRAQGVPHAGGAPVRGLHVERAQHGTTKLPENVLRSPLQGTAQLLSHTGLHAITIEARL